MGKKARRRQRAAMNEMQGMVAEQLKYFQDEKDVQGEVLDQQKKQFQEFQFENPFADIKNPYEDLKTEFENIYADLENPYEDLTVNTRAAEFQAEQGAQQRANILSTLRGAAGGAGIGGLAQALANQGQRQAQQISANIAQQETANQRLAAQGEARRQQLIAQGQNISQQMEAGKQGQLLGLADERLREANLARQQATQALVGGIGNLATGAVSIATGGGFGG